MQETFDLGGIERDKTTNQEKKEGVEQRVLPKPIYQPVQISHVEVAALLSRAYPTLEGVSISASHKIHRTSYGELKAKVLNCVGGRIA